METEMEVKKIITNNNNYMKGDNKMKDKIMLFIIGVLVGAVISTGSFYIYTTTNNNCSNNTMETRGGQPPEMPNNNNQNGQPPEMPGENSTQNSNNETNNN